MPFRYMLLPFCYMSFYTSNRKFFQDEVAAKLYHPSAYYLAQAVAGDLTADQPASECTSVRINQLTEFSSIDAVLMFHYLV